MNVLKPQPKMLTRICALLLASQLGVVLANEPTIREVKPNDTLSRIVVQAYPDYSGNRRAVMQIILEKNLFDLEIIVQCFNDRISPIYGSIATHSFHLKF